jgi:hypothetical protein
MCGGMSGTGSGLPIGSTPKVMDEALTLGSITSLGVVLVLQRLRSIALRRLTVLGRVRPVDHGTDAVDIAVEPVPDRGLTAFGCQLDELQEGKAISGAGVSVPCGPVAVCCGAGSIVPGFGGVVGPPVGSEVSFLGGAVQVLGGQISRFGEADVDRPLVVTALCRGVARVTCTITLICRAVAAVRDQVTPTCGDVAFAGAPVRFIGHGGPS